MQFEGSRFRLEVGHHQEEMERLLGALGWTPIAVRVDETGAGGDQLIALHDDRTQLVTFSYHDLTCEGVEPTPIPHGLSTLQKLS